MSGVAGPLTSSIDDKYSARQAVVAPLIHDVFGAIYKPSVKRLYQAGSAMRGRDRPGGDPSRPGHLHCNTTSLVNRLVTSILTGYQLVEVY